VVEGQQQEILEDDDQTVAEDNGHMETAVNGFSRIAGLCPFFAGRLAERNILDPTEIQRQVIPLLLEGRSVIFRSSTGTGKTFAYLIPMFQRLFGLSGGDAGPADAPGTADGGWRGDPGGVADGFPAPVRGSRDGPAMLILAPTHELCAQIKAEADFLLRGGFAAPGCPAAPRILLIIGQASMSRQIESLKKERPAIVVGNPSRILALAKMGKLRFGGLRFLVLDEGDRLLSDDTYETAAELAALIHRRKFSPGPAGMSAEVPDAEDPAAGNAGAGVPASAGFCAAACSATLSARSHDRLLPLLGKTREEVAVVETDEAEILREKISHWALFSERRRKTQTLRSLRAALKPKKALVVSGRGGEPEKTAADLQYHHIHAVPLFGDMDGKSRKEAVDGFRSGRIPVLVSSDLAARGLDIPGITHVIALDVPEEGEVYIHRAGRTGRAGKRGIMITIGDAGEMHRLVRLEKKLRITVYPKELYGGKVYAADAPDDGGAGKTPPDNA
jgi:superfamily II DNA/RNA helicase